MILHEENVPFFPLVNTIWNSCLTVFCKTLRPISSLPSPTYEWRKCQHTQLSTLIHAHNSPLFLLPEAINVEKRFYKAEQE